MLVDAGNEMPLEQKTENEKDKSEGDDRRATIAEQRRIEEESLKKIGENKRGWETYHRYLRREEVINRYCGWVLDGAYLWIAFQLMLFGATAYAGRYKEVREFNREVIEKKFEPWEKMAFFFGNRVASYYFDGYYERKQEKRNGLK